MATYTQNYNLKMPSGQDAPDVEDFNTNAEIIDTVLKAHSDNTADEYSPDETYTAGRLVINNNALWKAKQDINVAEAWTPEHWELTTLAAELSAVNSRGDIFSINTFSGKNYEVQSGTKGIRIKDNVYVLTLIVRCIIPCTDWTKIGELPDEMKSVDGIQYGTYNPHQIEFLITSNGNINAAGGSANLVEYATLILS